MSDANEPPKPISKAEVPALDSLGFERPPFLLSFPTDVKLQQLVQAFEQGNYAWVRTEAPKLAAATESAEVRRAALELRRRISPDPLVVMLLSAALALFCFLVIWSYV